MQDSQAIAAELMRLRSKFSLDWYQKSLRTIGPNFLPQTIEFLFRYTGHPNECVAVGAHNALGALFLTISPFHSLELIDAFSKVVPRLSQIITNISPSTSVAVISCFVFLSRHMAPHGMKWFMENVIVLHHFSAEVHSFVQYIPQLVKNMKNLEIGFYRQLMQSLLLSFGRNPNSYFIDALINIIMTHPVITSDLITIVKSQGMMSTLIAVGGHLLREDSLYEWVSVDDVLTLFDEVKKLFVEIPSATCIEQCVGVVHGLMKRENDVRTDVLEFVDDLLERDFPEHIKRGLIPLTRSVDKIKLCEDDSSNVLVIKIKALSRLVAPENADEVADMIIPYLRRGRDEYGEAVKLFTDNFEVFRLNIKDQEKVAMMISFLFDKKNLPWTHKVEVVNFIGMNCQFVCADIFKNYMMFAIDFLIDSALSQHDWLSSVARKAFVNFIALRNVDKILIRLRSVDLFDQQVALRTVTLLNVLIENVSSLSYSYFVQIFCELMKYDKSVVFQSEVFLFLSHFRALFYDNKELEHACLSLMQRCYWSFTQRQLLPYNTEDMQDSGSIVSTMTTDIVADSALSCETALRPLLNCFKYLITFPPPNFMKIAIAVLPLFPYESLKIINSSKLSPSWATGIMPVVEMIFDTCESWEVLSLCTEFFRRKVPEKLPIILERLDSSAQIKANVSGEICDSIFKAIYDCDPVTASRACLCMLSTLQSHSKLEAHCFLVNIRSTSEGPYMRGTFPFLRIGTEDENGAFEWFEANPPRVWPVRDREYVFLLIDFLQRCQKKVLVNDLEGIDRDQFLFLTNNIRFFRIKDYEYFVAAKRNELKQFAWETPLNDPQVHLSIDKSVISVLPTISPMVKRGKYITDSALLVSFFEHSHVKMNESMFNEIMEQVSDENVTKAAVSYAERLSIPVKGQTVSPHRLTGDDLCMKSKNLLRICQRLACRYYSETDIVGILQWLYENLSLVTNLKRLLLYIRVMRIVWNFPVVNSDMQAIIKTVANELLASRVLISMDECDIRKSYIHRDLGLFISDVLSDVEQKRIAVTDPYSRLFFSVFNISRISEINTEIPSHCLYVISLCNHYKSVNPLPLVEEKLAKHLKNPVVASSILEFASTHIEWVKSPMVYLTELLDPAKPLLADIHDSFIPSLIFLAGDDVRSFKSFFTGIQRRGSFLPHIISYMSGYYMALQKNTYSDIQKKQTLVVDDVKTSHQIFARNPSLSNAIDFARCLVRNYAYFDCLFLIIGNLATKDIRFLSVLMLAKYYLDLAPDSERDRYDELMNQVIQVFPYVSRGKSLACFIQKVRNLPDSVFLCALTETNDEDLIEKIFQEYP